MASAPSHAPLLTHEYIFLRHYKPVLIRTDQITSTMQELLYQREYPKSLSTLKTLDTLTAASYAADELPALHTCLTVRNELALVCGVNEQRVPFRDNLGYTVDNAIPNQVLDPIELSELRVGGVPMHGVGKGYGQQELERYYLPFLHHLDAVISNMERVIFEHEWAKWGNNGKIQQIIYNPAYDAPDAVRRNALLATRNEWAKKLGLPRRQIHNHDMKNSSPWHMQVDGAPLPNLQELRPTQFEVKN